MQRSRSLRYSLRQLFIAMAFFGVFLGWVGSQLKWKRDRTEAQMWLQPLAARAQAATNGLPIPENKGNYVQTGQRDAPWPLSLLGVDGVERIELLPESIAPGAIYSRQRFELLFPEATVVVLPKEPPEPVSTAERLIVEK